jgi:hypothetical protein
MDEGYAKSGYEGAMLAAAQLMAERSRHEYVKPFVIALHYAAAKQKEEALHWLEKACEERDLMLTLLRVDDAWDFLRSDPRFQDIISGMNFPE